MRTNLSVLKQFLLQFSIFQGALRWGDTKMRRGLHAAADSKKMIVAPILRLVVSLTSMVETSDFFEVAVSNSFHFRTVNTCMLTTSGDVCCHMIYSLYFVVAIPFIHRMLTKFFFCNSGEK